MEWPRNRLMLTCTKIRRITQLLLGKAKCGLLDRDVKDFADKTKVKEISLKRNSV